MLRALGSTEIPVENLEAAAAAWLNETRAHVAPRTTVRRISSVRMFARVMLKTSILDDYTPPKPKRLVPKPIAEGIDGVERMCMTARNDGERALFAMQGYVGLRVSEALSAVPSSFNVADPGDIRLTVRGKGDKERELAVSAKAWGYILPAYKAALRRNRALVELSDKGARNAVTRAGAKLGFKNAITSHSLRATLATDLLNKTGNIRLVQEVLGHSHVTTTEAYTLVSSTHMRDGMELVGGEV